MSDAREMPADIKAERAALGALLINGSAFDRVAPIVTAADFYREEHRAIFTAAERMEGRGVDGLTMIEELRQAGQLTVAGGAAYVSGLLDGVPDIANIEKYARIVADRSFRRKVIFQTQRLQLAAYDVGEPVSDVAAEGAQLFTDCAGMRDTGPVSIRTLAQEAVQDIEARATSGDAMTGLTTSLAGLDGLTLGWQRGVESILAARLRVGKTALALCSALANAEAGKRTLFVELDMSREMLSKRLIANVSGVSYARIRSGQFLTPGDWQEINKAERHLSALGDHLICDYATRHIAKLTALIRREARQGGLDLVFVDHIGHVKGGKGDLRYLELGDVSSRLIEVAAETGAAVVSLAQLGREAEKREPCLSDLRESGNLEQDARTVVLLDRPFLRDDAGHPACELSLIVAKNEGEAGARLTSHFDLDRQQITEQPTRHCRCHAAVREVQEARR
jgi:replicative DNA helicase